MKPWSEVEASEEFQALDQFDQSRAQTQYFDEVVAPQLGPEDLEPARGEFFSQFNRAYVPEDSGQGPVESAFNQGIQSLAKVGTGTIEGLGQAGSSYVRNLNPVGIAAKLGVPGAQTLVDAYSSIPEAIARGAGDVQESVEEIAPTNPLLADTAAQKVAGVTGQVVGQLGTMLTGAAITKLPRVIQAIGLGQAGLLGMESGYAEADRLGVTEPWKRDTLAASYALAEAGVEGAGGFGSIGFSRALTGEVKDLLTKGALRTFGKTAVVEGLEEPVTGTLQSGASNVLADQDPQNPGYSLNGARLPSIDPTTGEFWGARSEEFVLGMYGGALFGGAQVAMSKPKLDQARRLKQQVDLTVEVMSQNPELTEQERAELEELRTLQPNLSTFIQESEARQAAPTARAINTATESAVAAGMPQAASAMELFAEASAATIPEPAPFIAPKEEVVIEEAPAPDAIPVVETDIAAQLGHEGNQANFTNLLDGLSAWAQANPELAGYIRDSGGLRAALVGGATDPARNQTERGDLDTLIEDNTFDAATGQTQVDRLDALRSLTGFLNTWNRQDGKRVQQASLQESIERSETGPSTTLIDISEQANARLAPVVQQDASLAVPTVQTPVSTENAPQASSVSSAGAVSVETARAVAQSQKGVLPSAESAWVGTREELLNNTSAREAWITHEMRADPNETRDTANASFERMVKSSLTEALTFGGSTYLIPDGIRVYKEDGTPEEAVKRVLRHEDTHIAIDTITEADPARKAEWESLKRRIDPRKLDALVRRYPYMANWREDPISFNNLAHEYFAEQMEREEAGLAVDDQDLLTRFIEFIRKVLNQITGREVSIQEIRDFVKSGRVVRSEIQDTWRLPGRASNASLTPQERLKEINDAFAYETVAGQQEGLNPTKATIDQRTFVADGTPVDFSRQGMTNVQQQALAAESVDLLSTLSPDGRSKTFGKDLMAYLSGSTRSMYGQQLSDLQQTAVLNYLEGSMQDRAQMGIDGAEIRRVRSQKLSRAGALLQTAASTIYTPLRDIAERAEKATDKAMSEEGVDPVKMAEEIKADVSATQTEIAKDISQPEVKATILDAAQNDADELYELGLSGLDPKFVAMIRERDERIVRIGRLRQLEAMLSGGPRGAKASLAALPENMTLEEVRAMIAKEEAEVQKLTSNIEAASKKQQRKARTAKDKEKENNVTFSEWVMGKSSADIGMFDDLLQKYSDPNGFNREAFTTLLTNKFEDADPNMILGVVNRYADLMDGAATEEGAEVDTAKAPNFDARAKRIVGRSIAWGSQPELEAQRDAFKDLTMQRLKEEIPADEFQSKLEEMGVEEQTAFAMNRKVEEDTAKRKAAKAMADERKRMKADAAAAKREHEKWMKSAEAKIATLAKEFSDTLSQNDQKTVNELQALMNNFIGSKGPPITEEQFIEDAKKLNIPEATYTRLMGVLDMQRKRATAVADAKNRQKEAARLAAEERKEREKNTKEAEARIAALSKEFSDTLPSKAQAKEMTELQRLIADYTGKNGPVISDEVFETRASALNIPEGVLDRLRGVLQMQRKRESMAADAKFRQAEAERLEKERLKFDREALTTISKLATQYSDTLSEKAKKDASDLKVLSDSFLGRNGPPISEDTFLERAAKLNLKDSTATNLLKILSETRRRESAVRYAKAVQKAAEAKQRAIESAVKKLTKTKTGSQAKLRQQSTFVKGILGALEGGILESDAIRQAFAEAYNLHGLTSEVLKDLGARLQEINGMREGITKETALNEFNVALNAVAPSSSFVGHAHSALMGYILSGMNTMLMQLTGVNRFINPLSNTVEILYSAPGTTAEKLGRTMNPVNFLKLYTQGLREVAENLPQVQAGISGLISSQGKGVGAMPSNLAAVKPRETSMAWTPWGQLSNARFNTPKLLEQMGLGKFAQATRYPAWMVSRSFQAIRAAEGIIGGADKNMQWRSQMTNALMQSDPSMTWAKAYTKVSEALGDRTTEMWQEAYKQTDEEIKVGTVAKLSRSQRATELVQDKIEAQWELDLKNRPREIAALYGYKQDPLTPAGAWVYQGLSRFLNQDKGAMQYAKFSFLFARFFANAIETAYTRTPLAGLAALALPTSKPEGTLSEREQRIEQIYGSLGAYRDARMGRAISGTAFMGALAGLMIMALKGWDPDDEDEPPFFWISGDPIGEFSKKGAMEAGGWWKANTLYMGPLRLNYVNASPEMATIMGAMGAMGDRFLYDKLLNYRENKETGEYTRSNYEAYGKPVLEALAAPISRSTYRQWYDALESAYAGDFKKMTRIIANPAVGTAVALSPIGIIPSVKTLEKWDRSTEQPRSAQSATQAVMASVPFASELGLDPGKPLTTPFGNPLTPYPFWSVFSNTQEVPPEVGKAARTLTDLGVARMGPKEEYFGWGVAEIAHDGKKFLLNDEERAVVLGKIGSKFARLVNQNTAKLRKLEAGPDGRDKVRTALTGYAKQARSEALYQYRRRAS